MRKAMSAKLALALISGLATSGCAVNSMDRDGMRTTGTNFPILGGFNQTRLDPVAAGMGVMEAGLANPNPNVARAAQELSCTTPGLNRIATTRSSWQRASGQTPICPEAPAETAPNDAETRPQANPSQLRP